MALATVPDVGRSATNEKITTQGVPPRFGNCRSSPDLVISRWPWFARSGQRRRRAEPSFYRFRCRQWRPKYPATEPITRRSTKMAFAPRSDDEPQHGARGTPRRDSPVVSPGPYIQFMEIKWFAPVDPRKTCVCSPAFPLTSDNLPFW
jgi:hypothetical protein